MKKKTNIKTDYINDLHSVFINSMYEIEALDEFYNRCAKNYGEYSSESIKDILFGVKIYTYFVQVLSGKTVDECNKKIDEINNELIDNNHRIKDICSIEKFKEGDQLSGIRFTINDEFKNKREYYPNLARKTILEISIYQRIVYESFLSNLIVVFESFLSSIYDLLLKSEPLKYLADKKVPFPDLLNMSHERCIKEIRAKEIEAKMYDSLQLIKRIEEEEKISINRFRNLFNEFSEIYYRRNAYVHSKGYANSDYMKKVPQSVRVDVNKGDYLHCDDEYCNKAIEIVSSLVFSVVFELAKKKEATFDDLVFLQDYYFERLKNRDYLITKYAYQILKGYDGFSFAERLNYHINYINSLKQLNETDLVNEELKHLDVSATDIKFRIAKECLLGNNDVVFELLCESYPNSFDAIAIKEWPIFINFRESNLYQQFINKYTEDFSINEVERIDRELDIRRMNTNEDDSK